MISHILSYRKENKSSTLWSLFDEMLVESEENSVGHGCENSAKITVQMYLKEPVLSHVEHIHILWKEKKACSHVCMVDLVCKYLSIPPLFSCI